MIHIAGLGPGDAGSITMETYNLFKNTKVVLRTKIHPTVATLEDWRVEYRSLDHVYEENDSFEEVYSDLAKEVLKLYQDDFKDMTYCVPGNPLIAEKSVVELVALLKEAKIPYKIHSAVSFIDVILEVLERDPIKGLLILDAQDLGRKGITGETDTILTQVYNKRIASEVKLALTDYLDDETEIIYIRNAGIGGEELIRKIPLWALDRQEDIDHLTSVFIEADAVKPGFNDFRRTISTLREPGGCPWDREQTHESLRRYLIEEAYEAADAITEGEMDDVREELGDVLLQVVLHSRIAEENGDFTIQDVIRTVNEKMITRHPHVFSNLEVDDTKEVLYNCEKIKKTEKGEMSLAEKLEKLPRSVPATMRAQEVIKKAKSYGYASRSTKELIKQLTDLLKDEALNEEKKLADVLFYTVLLVDAYGFQAESSLSERVDYEIKQLVIIDEKLK